MLRPFICILSMILSIVGTELAAQSQVCSAVDLRTIPFNEFKAQMDAYSEKEAQDTSNLGLDFSNLDVSAILDAANEPEALTGLNLSGVDFTCANLAGINLVGTTFIETDFSGATLDGADLKNARLSGAVLKNASLVASIFNTNSSLIAADLSGSHLTGTVLENVVMTGANLSNAIIVDTRLKGASLDNVIVSEALWSPKGALDSDALGGMTGLATLKVSFCSDRRSEADPKKCASISERPDLAALELLRKSFKEGGDDGAVGEVSHAIEKARTDHAWAKVDRGDLWSLPYAMYRYVLHFAFVDHGLGHIRAFFFLCAMTVAFAALYFALHRQNKRRTIGGLFWAAKSGVERVDAYNRIKTENGEDLWAEQTPRQAAWAALCYSLVATTRIGLEHWSVLSLVAGHLPFTRIAGAVGAPRWIGGFQTGLVALLVWVWIPYL